MEQQQILVLGVGNILLCDEGVGVRVVEKLQDEYSFSFNVQLVDGGTLGLKLLDLITHADYLIVVDAVLNDEPPGTFYRLLGDDLRKSLAFKHSLHQADLVETLIYAEMLGKAPTTVVLGIEPVDYTSWGTELTEPIQRLVPEMCHRVLEEIRQAGGSFTPLAA